MPCDVQKVRHFPISLLHISLSFRRNSCFLASARCSSIGLNSNLLFDGWRGLTLTLSSSDESVSETNGFRILDVFDLLLLADKSFLGASFLTFLAPLRGTYSSSSKFAEISE